MKLPWWLWLTGLVLWTGLLLAPGYWFGSVRSEKFVILDPGKLLHVVAYGGLAATAGWMNITLGFRRLMIPALIVHGGLTELAQNYVPARSGTFFDWGLDTACVLIGLAATIRRWPADQPAAEQTVNSQEPLP